jgi:hypothetical protein
MHQTPGLRPGAVVVDDDIDTDSDTTPPPYIKTMIEVILPDMFVLFLSQPPRVNPGYDRVRKASEAWISRYSTSVFINLSELTNLQGNATSICGNGRSCPGRTFRTFAQSPSRMPGMKNCGLYVTGEIG